MYSILGDFRAIQCINLFSRHVITPGRLLLGKLPLGLQLQPRINNSYGSLFCQGILQDILQGVLQGVHPGVGPFYSFSIYINGRTASTIQAESTITT
jgi:hypothetical protein